MSNRSQVLGSRFWVRGKVEIDPRNSSKKCGFCTSLPSTMLQICGYEEPVGFLVQIVYKKAYGDENTTFEPLNL